MAFGLDRLDQLFERQVLMGVGVDRRVAHLLQQRGKRLRRVDAGAQHQCIDEQADHRFQFRARAVGHRRTEAQILLAGVTRQECAESGAKHHEQRCL